MDRMPDAIKGNANLPRTTNNKPPAIKKSLLSEHLCKSKTKATNKQQTPATLIDNGTIFYSTFIPNPGRLTIYTINFSKIWGLWNLVSHQ